MDERELIRLSQAGNLDAFEQLVLGRRTQVFRIARQLLGDDEEAKDVAQLVFLRVWQSLGRYREGGSFPAWLHRITVNLALDLIRRRRAEDRPEALDPERIDAAAAAPGPAPDAPGPEEIARIFRVLARRLTPKQRAAFVLREIEGMTTDETAEILGMRESTVRNHVLAARRILQEGLRRMFPEYVAPGGGRNR
jgi:RNA polymerase sigma-70 factor (ECF subfamily)